MKKLMTLLTFLFLAQQLHAITAKEILQKMDDAGEYKTAKMNATMTIIDKKGRETKMSLTMHEQKEGDKSLMRFTAPARLKGTAILTVGDNIWYYNNRTNRVRLLSKSAKKGSMMGSSFSYEDMSANYIDDYDAEIIKETKDKYFLKMIPKDKDLTYKHLIAEVLKENFIGVKVEYYNKNDLKYKELTSKDIKDIKGHIGALFVSMKEITSQKITNFELDEDSVEYDIKINKNLFSERYLKK